MKYLRDRSGTGYVKVSEKRFGPFKYRLIIHEEGLLKSGAGTLEGAPGSLNGCFDMMAASRTLDLGRGDTAEIIITSVHAYGYAEFVTTGPVPGF